MSEFVALRLVSGPHRRATAAARVRSSARPVPTDRTVVLAERGNVFATGPAPVERCETAIIWSTVRVLTQQHAREQATNARHYRDSWSVLHAGRSTLPGMGTDQDVPRM